MPKGTELAKAGCPYLGRKYSEMDCQKFVEACLRDIGLRKNLAGSNAWFRECKRNGWVGSPKECRRVFGMIPGGAFLFIHNFDGGEEDVGYHDGLGNASHIGIYTAMSGAEMVALAIEAGDTVAPKYNFGNGAIHSSSKRKAVATSEFAGETIKGGWNMIGLWIKISYGESVDRILRGKGEETVLYQAKVVGGGLNMRSSPEISAERMLLIPDGTILTVEEESGEWAKTSYLGKTGWVMKKYLEKIDADKDSVVVSRKELEKLYDTIGDWLGLRG